MLKYLFGAITPGAGVIPSHPALGLSLFAGNTGTFLEPVAKAVLGFYLCVQNCDNGPHLFPEISHSIEFRYAAQAERTREERTEYKLPPGLWYAGTTERTNPERND